VYISEDETKFHYKLYVGICGTGLNMLRWKRWPTDQCPRCGEHEIPSHVWVCHGEEADKVWLEALRKLQNLMAAYQTDPEVAKAILE
jgi:hypothetical protein